MRFVYRLLSNRFAVLGISLGLYILACALPALQFVSVRSEDREWRGATLLLIGWVAIGLGQIAWIANPILLVSWIFLLLRLWKPAELSSLFAAIAGLSTLTLFFHSISGDEAQFHFHGVSVGFYLWILSIVFINLGAEAGGRLNRRTMDKRF